ncbi:MAG: hypothetical protein NVS3B25_04470 [Hymenobacter sp.]
MGTVAGGLGAGCVRKSFFQADARINTTSPLPSDADSAREATAGRQYAHHGHLYNVLIGPHHRRTWAAPVAAPVLNLAQARPSGLRPGKIGGGFNSTSLGLKAANGQAFVLRTVDKDPIRAMPEWLRHTFLVNALRDNVSATHPYGALVVPPLAAALGVPHASPRLYYVRAEDPAFRSDSLNHFRGQLAYLEEKAGPSALIAGGTAERVLSSREAFAAVFLTPSQRIDQPALLRARLLDGWLGDWDRHPGQWSWAVARPTGAAGATLLPIPKDRDMVFYRLDDGVLGWLLGHVAQRHWATFGPRFRNAASLLSSGQYLDTRGLNALSGPAFRTAARAMQQRLPDSLLRRALNRLPAAALALEGPRLLAALQARRAALPELAEGWYRHLARRPVVGGTAEAERFEVHRYADSTVVAVYPAKTAASLFHRTFLPAETCVIQVEGLGGNDHFVVVQHGRRPVAKPRLRLYGGPGVDTLQSQQTGHGLRFWQGSVAPPRAYDKPPKE